MFDVERSYLETSPLGINAMSEHLLNNLALKRNDHTRPESLNLCTVNIIFML
jgi:hypothetical protein